MKINNVSLINFGSKIIDSHCHIGNWNEGDSTRNYTSDFDTFIHSELNNGDTIEKVIVSNLDCMTRDTSNKFLFNELDGNKQLAEFAKRNSKIAPLATCQPGYGNVKNIEQLFTEAPNTFVGLKFHPEQLKIIANDKLYEPYLAFATEKNIPCLFHSGSSEFSNPNAIEKLAKKFPKADIIIAHWGAECGGNYDIVTDIIIDSVKNKKTKIYADISWVDCNDPTKPTLNKIIKRLKQENALDRIIFGSDAPLGRFGGNGENNIKPLDAYLKMVEDVKNMIKKEYTSNDADEIINKIFYKNYSLRENKNQSKLQIKKCNI